MVRRISASAGMVAEPLPSLAVGAVDDHAKVSAIPLKLATV
jgi:hypothetical protein